VIYVATHTLGWYVSAMEIYRFHSAPKFGIRAFTSDVTGQNLPADYAPWFVDNAGAPVGNQADTVLNAIRHSGFFLTSAGSHRGLRSAQTSERARLSTL
jgi:hypothetical protein